MIDLDRLIKDFNQKTGLLPLMATEIEFYLRSMESEIPEELLKDLHKKILKAKIPAIRMERERGPNQLEVPLMPSPNIQTLAKNTEKLKEIIKSFAEENGFEADFSAKPYPDHPGSGLHIHLSFLDSQKQNIFAQKNGEEENENLLCAVGGMLAALPESMIYFAPNPESYSRFTAGKNVPRGTYDNAPTNISWGANNRTTAIRIPSSTANPISRHIEHRVSGADAEPLSAIAAVLAGAIYGIENKISPPDKIYGNAYDKIYDLTPLPKSLEDAKKLNEDGEILKGYF